MPLSSILLQDFAVYNNYRCWYWYCEVDVQDLSLYVKHAQNAQSTKEMRVRANIQVENSE